MDRTALPLSISSVQVYWDRGEVSLCTIRVYIYRFITYWGILETILLISRLSTWLLPTVSISLLRFSLTKTSLFSQWGYFAGRFTLFFVCQFQPGSSWSGMSLISLVFALHVTESFGTCCRVVSVQLWRPWFCFFSLVRDALFSLVDDFWFTLKGKTFCGCCPVSVEIFYLQLGALSLPKSMMWAMGYGPGFEYKGSDEIYACALWHCTW